MMKNTIKALVMATFACAAAAAWSGDIISIDVLSGTPYSLVNGGKKYPNPDSPHTIGETVTIRMRLVNDDQGGRSTAYPWFYASPFVGAGSWATTAPRLGLSVGGVLRYATMVSIGSTAVSTKQSERYFTDLIFEYTVQPGDLAQPLKLMNKSGYEAENGDEYLVECYGGRICNMVDTSDATDVQRDAVFSFFSDSDSSYSSLVARLPPAGTNETGLPKRDYTLEGASVYIKTIDFDSNYVDTSTDPKVWRTIAQGSTKPTKFGNPSIAVDAAAQFEGTGYATMWVWTENDAILTPVGETQTFNVGGTDRKALPVTISTGDEVKSFILKAAGTEGQGAWVYMSSAPTNMYGSAGDLIKNTVRRWVTVGAPEKPSVSVTFGGNSWTQATATEKYMDNDYPVEMAITLSEPFSEDVTVTLTPILKNNDADPATNVDVYANHIIATAPATGMGNGWQLATNSVTFAKNDEVEKFLYVYPLGATKESARNGGTGIEFQITVEPASANSYFVTKTPGVLYVNPATPNVVAPVANQAYEFTAGIAKDIEITIDDACRNMRYLDAGAAEIAVEGTNFYSVVWERNDDTSTSTMEWKCLKPVLTSGKGVLTLKDVKYPNSGTYLTSQITVTSPDGTKTVIPVSAEVSVPRTVTGTPDHEDLAYSEGDTVKLTLNLSKRDGESLYAFVEPLNSDATNFLAGAQMIGADGKATGRGVEIPGTGTTTPKTINLTVLDGPCEPKFQIVLCSTETFDAANVVDRYTPQPVTLFCANTAPAGEKLVVGGGSINASGEMLEYSIPADNPVSLAIQIGDVQADRNLGTQPNETLLNWIAGADPDVFTNGLFITKWDFFNAKGKKTETRITVGSRNRQAVTNFTFTSIGTNRVEVQMLDKDMIKALLDSGVRRDEIVKWSNGSTVVPYGDETGFWSTSLVDDDWGPKFVGYVTVEDKANVSIVPVNVTVNAEGESGFYEGATAGGFDIVLSVPAPVPLTVKLWIERMARTDGVANNVGTRGSFELKNKELGMSTNEYVEVTFRRGVDVQRVSITGMDGTPYSSYRLHAVVTTTTKNDDDIRMCDFYNESFYDFGVFNKDPVLRSITANVGISYNQSTGLASTNVVTLSQNQEVTIGWTVADFIRMDETNNFTVTWNSSEPGSRKTTNNSVSGTYTTKFSTAGEKTITLTVSDKDGGANFYEWSFKVEASKRLYLYPRGPSADALSDAVATSYILASGLGVGTVEADGAFGGIRKFAQTWDYSVSASTAHIYARGLKKGEKDNSDIVRTGRTWFPTQTGAQASSAANAYVNNSFKNNQAFTNLDSFVYAFIINTAADDSQFTPTLKRQVQVGWDPVSLAVSLPIAEKDAIAYPDRYVEAIFAREWLPEDNLGDINGDGVPDEFAVKKWRGGYLLDLVSGASAASALGLGTDVGSDLVNLASSNPDEDYLPGIYNGAANTYAPHSKNPLTTRLEIRGFDTGLNDRRVSVPSFSDDERFAWNQYAADKGLDATADLALDTWSPEPSGKFDRMDPTLADTDDDNFPDGWEYYFWYMAKVWVPSYTWRRAHPNDLDSNGDKLYDSDKTYAGEPRSGQFHVFERFNINNIIRGDEISLDEVLARFNPCEPYNAEKFKGNKRLKNDFDGDGLSDLEELAIGTNPCHWDTDGDRLCDSWEVMMCLDPLSATKGTNPDGDFMAYRAVRLDMCWIDPADIASAGLTLPPSAGGMPEDVRVYGLPGLQLGVDYDLTFDTTEMRTKYVMLQTKEIVSYSFNPKWNGTKQIVYGLREDIPSNIPANWIWGWYMVDKVRCEKITLNAGDEIFADLQFVLIHDQVRDGFGFDPRTAWNNVDGYVSTRWDPSKNSTLSIFDETGLAVNTRPYETYDEYLVMKYRLDYGIDYSPNSNTDNGLGNNETIWAFMERKTTNPNNVHPVTDEEGGTTGEDTPSVAERLADLLNEAGKPPVTTHGADTDQDGVPDGWELYTYRCPNAAPVRADEDGLGKPAALDFDGDALSYREEYAGVDSCDAYKDCESIYGRHPGKGQGWWNKFFPTNPGTMKLFDETLTVQIFAGQGNADGADTDLDGVVDGIEGGSWNVVFANGGSFYSDVELGFVYGSPEDDGITVCFRGGGMNPCTIDTDLDGLPDGWEMQHAGVPVQLPGKTLVAPRGGKLGNAALDDATFIADGIFATNAEGEEGEGLPSAVYIAGGMDATWSGDAIFTTPNNSTAYDPLLGTVRDVDFDHDGLQNCQEYLTQATRHFRYDDITTPLMGRQLEEGQYDPQTKAIVVPHTQSFGDTEAGTGNDGTGTGYPVFDSADPSTFAANAAEAWNGRSFVYYETVTTGVKKVVKVVDAYTGATETNTYYYTAQRKRHATGALLVEKHVAAGGTALQQPWTDDGWRAVGYFAPPRREWDRAVASAKFGDRPLYMLPITDNQMVAADTSVAGYATTDPRVADTDGDGMDDFYETFHGLNPLLGTTPANAAQTEWIGSKHGDIVSAQFYMAAGGSPTVLRFFNAWYNEWIYPTYSGLLGRSGSQPGDAVGTPISAPQAYDPVLYPWGMGSPMADADGDGLRNDEERITANVADPVARHTDPTPLWFSERTTPASYVAQYYVKPESLAAMPWGVAPSGAFQAAALMKDTDATDSIYFGPNGVTYQFSFEENEGYDTDGDMVPDATEVVSTVRPSSDMLRFDDPSRRQALYLPGAASYAVSRDLNFRAVDSEDFLKQFTVECWVMPEKSGVAQTIVERSVAIEGDSINTAAIAIRANFRIGIDEQGRVYGMFDNNDSIESGLDSPRSCQYVDGGLLPLNKWSHVALTFDGSTLVIYVDAVQMGSAPTKLAPANGVVQILQYPGDEGGFPASGYKGAPCAMFIGARPIRAYRPGTAVPNGYYALYPYYIENGAHMESFDNLREYFKGYVDEVRVWDGARSATQILENYRKSIDFAEASTNREEVFAAWYNDNATRNNNDGKLVLPAELVLNYDFSTLPGAINETDVVKNPAGFTKNVLAAAMSDYASNGDIDTTGLYPNLMELKGSAGDGSVEGDLLVGWWNDCLVHSTVYDDYHVVPWIKNTVGHLPLMDGSSPDSFIYANDFGAVYTPAGEFNLGKFTFPNTAVPYSSTVFNYDGYYRVAHADRRYEQRGKSFAAARARSEFQVRDSFVGTSDLVPMGGAFAKTCPDMWDGGAADPWEQTGGDANGDGIPDWWEEYARANYSPDVDPALPITWDTVVDYHGVKIAAGRAYVFDIFHGMQPDGTTDSAYAVNADKNGNNIPDWWENLFGITGQAADADADGDGLSNMVEYMLSEVFNLTSDGKWICFAPDDARSVNPNLSDYFYRLNQLYVGEIFTDHDRIGDEWESSYLAGSGISPYDYDADLDTDGDGWPNYAEYQASTDPTKTASLGVDAIQMDEYPIPTIELTICYRGAQNVADMPIVVKAWSDQTLASVPDAVWTLGGDATTSNTGNGNSKAVSGTKHFGMNPMREMLVHLSPGSIVPGTVLFEFKDLGWVLYNTDTQESFAMDPASAIWIGRIKDLQRTDDATMGDIIRQGEPETSFGTINYVTGEMRVDFAAFPASAGITGDISEARQGDNWMSVYNLQKSYVRVTWQSKLTTGGKVGTYYLAEADKRASNNNSFGHVKNGMNTFVVFYDMDKNGKYTPGEPFGTIRDVDVGWNYACASVELTDTTPVMVRYDPTEGDGTATDREKLFPDDATDVPSVPEGLSAPAKDLVRIRIARFAVDSLEYGRLPADYMAVVYDRVLDLTADGHGAITEADILSDMCNKFDIDWDAESVNGNPVGSSLTNVVKLLNGTLLNNGVPATFTKLYYTVYIGNDLINPLVLTNNNVLSKVLVRKFGKAHQVPVPISTGEGVPVSLRSPAPTFKWRVPLDGDDTYTAFRVSVTNAAGTFAWTSDYQLMPPRDSDGIYSWTPPIRIGAMTPDGSAEFKNGDTYSWSISAYNAKFRDDNWVHGGTFIANVQSNFTDCVTARVAVRYYGPTNVANSAVIRVQAFKTPDFSGEPVGEGYVTSTDELASTNAIKTANATISGLRAGTYYIRAFIDTEADGVRSFWTDPSGRRFHWESWGCFCTRDVNYGTIFVPRSVTVGPGFGASDIIPVFIDDCDTDGDSIPDSWEWATIGDLTTYGPASIDQNTCGFVMKNELTGSIGTKRSLSSGLAVMTAKNLKAPRVAALMLGVDATGSDGYVTSALGAAVRGVTAEPSAVAITGIEFDRGTGKVSITAETVGTSKDSFALTSDIYEFDPGSSTLMLKCKIWRRDSLESDDWTLVGTQEVEIGNRTTTYEIDSALGEDLSSGFFKATLEK